jgi:hypothetical protein
MMQPVDVTKIPFDTRIGFVVPAVPAQSSIVVVVPTIPPRRDTLLQRALDSVTTQTLLPACVVVVTDAEKKGAADTRQKALEAAVATGAEWVSFLDDDDTMYPHHLETHHRLLTESSADVAYSWFDGNDPFPAHRGRQFDPADPHHITMTITVRATLAAKAGFLQPDGPMHHEWAGEDWQFILRLVDLGATFIGTGDVTWTYQVHGANTSGLTSRW